MHPERVKRLGLPAALLVLLAVALLHSAPIWPQSRAILGETRMAGGISGNAGLLVVTQATLSGTTGVDSQERRLSRKDAIDDPLELAMALCDKDVRPRICQPPRGASWMTTLTAAAEPCTVLCRYLI